MTEQDRLLPDSSNSRTEILFIEDDVQDLDWLVAHVGAGKEVVVLDSTQDGVRQIADALRGRVGIDALHIVSHGAQGALDLGAVTLTGDNLAAYQAELGAIGASLAPGGDILLYGCDVGAGSGAAFVDRLAAATGADVAASDDATGAAALGGDWDLEVSSGTVASSLPAPLASGYEHLLAIMTPMTIAFQQTEVSYYEQTGNGTDNTTDVRVVNFGDGNDTAHTFEFDGAADAAIMVGGVEFAKNQHEDYAYVRLTGGEVFTATSMMFQSVAQSSLNVKIQAFDANNQQVGSTLTKTISKTLTAISFPDFVNVTTIVISSGDAFKLDTFIINNLAVNYVGPLDTTAPSVTISTDKTSLKHGDTATITFEFTEDPNNTFTAADVTVSGGSIGAVSGSGTTRTATFTPTDGVLSGSATITVAANSYTDAPGNGGAGASLSTITYDTSSAPANSVAPSVGGTAAVGGTLSASSGTWSDADGDTLSYTYQWYRASDSSGSGAAAISGKTTASYTATTSDTHQFLGVVVTADDGHGHTTTASSAWTEVGNTAPSNSARPTISVYGVGNTSTGAKGTWADADGDSLTYTYQWFRADTSAGGGKLAIDGATGSSYPVTTADAHKYLSLEVSASDGHGGTTTAGSTWTLVNNVKPYKSSLPSFSGTVKVGYTVTGDTGIWNDADGDTVTYTYQWMRANDASGTGTVFISGENAASYTLTSADAHKYLQLKIIADDGNGGTAVSFGGWKPVADAAPVNTAAPAVSGVASVGNTLGSTDGSWTDDDGDTLTFTYQWYQADDASGANATAVSGATGSSYTVAGTDAGKYVGVTVKANDGHGSQVQAPSSWSLVPNNLAVASIVRAGGASAAVDGSASSVQFTVTFTDAVTGVDAGDFTLTTSGTAGGAITAVSGSGATYTVTVGSLAGDGTVRLDLNSSGTGIKDANSVAIPAGYGAGQAYTLDHTAPAAPPAPDMSAGSDTGSSSTDNVTSNRQPLLAGTADAGSTVTVYDGATLLGTTTADAGGGWSFAPATALAEGSHAFTATATDAAGNVSIASAALAVTIDQTAPRITAVDGPAAGAYRAGDTLAFTVHTSEAVYLGSGAPTLPVFLSEGGGQRAAQYVSGAGTTELKFSYTVQAGDLDGNGIDVSNLDLAGASMSDAAGNVFDGALNAAVSTAGVRVDAVAPAISSVSVPAAATYYAGQHLDFTVNFSEAVVVDSAGGTPHIALTLDTGGTVYADYVSGSGTGALVFRHTVAGGEFDGTGITLGALSLQGGTVRDTAANDAGLTLNGVGSTSLVLVDGSQPAVTSVSSSSANGAYAAGASITIDVNMNRSVTVDTSGGVPTIALSSGGTAVYSGGSGSSTLSFTYHVGSGENTAGLDAASAASLSLNGATIRDAAGGHADANLALPAPGASGSLGHNTGIVIDTLAPSTAATAVAFSNDTGASASDLLTNAAAQTISGSLSAPLAAGETVKVSLDGGATWASASASAAGFTLAGLTLAGSGTLMVKVVDAAGNEGQVVSKAWALDAAAPAVAIGGLAPSSDTGASGSDKLTSVATPTFTGTAEPLALVKLYDTDKATLLGSATADGAGHWSITASSMAAGVHDVSATATDAAGNTGATSSSLRIDIDTAAPAAPAAPILAPESDSGAAGDGLTNVATPTVIGHGEAFAQVRLYDADGATVLGSAQADASGAWRITSSALADGTHALTVKETDAAGNVSVPGAALMLTIDTAAPAAPAAPALTDASDSDAKGDGVTINAPVIHGTALANARIELYDGATSIGSTVADASGAWTLAPALQFGAHTLSARQYDAAGNLSAASAAFALQYGAAPAPVNLVDGVRVGVATVLLPGGAIGTAVDVPIVPSARADSSGSAGVADIPLASSDSGAGLLVAQVAPGYGLSAQGGTSMPAASAGAALIGAIQAATSGHAAADQGHLAAKGQSFLDALAGSQQLLVETVVPVAAAAPAGALGLTGSGGAGPDVALVLDLSRLSSGGTIELRNVDFAAVIGAGNVVADTSARILSGDAASQHFTVAGGGSGAVYAGGGDDAFTWGLPGAGAAPGQGTTTVLHGGAGNDTATFNGSRDSFNIEYHNGYQVVSSKAEPNLKALVVNVETLAFADATVSVGNGDELATVAGLYKGIYGRQADLYGFEFWADAHQKYDMSWGKMAMLMITQGEWNAHHEALDGVAGHDVQVLYEALFGRKADGAGLDFWVGVMQQHGLSLEQVADYMVQSSEMNGHHDAVMNWDFLV